MNSTRSGLTRLRSADARGRGAATTRLGEDVLTTLRRPVGRNELKLIVDGSFKRFPPRLPEQPIFYPVRTFAYAEQIARDWNSVDERHAHVGYVTEFAVQGAFLAGYEPQEVGAQMHGEYWIPAEDLERFNDAIVGGIRVVAEYRHGTRVPDPET
jgi:hypothetical protein